MYNAHITIRQRGHVFQELVLNKQYMYFQLWTFLDASISAHVLVQASAGSYSDGQVVVLCPKGQYQPNTGQSVCFGCPSGYTTEGVGSDNVMDCSGKCHDCNWIKTNINLSILK